MKVYKIIITTFIVITMLAFAFNMVGCSETPPNNSDAIEISFKGRGECLEIEQILINMSELARERGRIVKFSLLVDKNCGGYKYEDVKVITDQHVSDFMNGVLNIEDAKYQVDCIDSEGQLSTEYCADYVCVGYYTAMCVENGGCATTCKVEISVGF